MNEVRFTVPNAILFIFDPTDERIVVPECVPGHITSANASCVSVSTRADVDGDVTVRLGSMLESDYTDCDTVLEHSIQTPSHKVAVVTSELKTIVTIDVPGDTARLTIGVDDPHSPSLICIGAQ